MTPTEVAATLRQFNEWRRGDYEPSEQPAPPDPIEIGEAIDAAVEMIERLEAAEKERDWHAGRCEDAMNEYAALRAKIETAENDAAHQKALAASALRVAEGWERKCGELRAEVIYWKEQKEPGAAGWRALARILQAKIDAMEKQEPVVEVQWAAGLPNSFLDFISVDRYIPKLGDKLYVLPGAKGE